MDDFSSARTFVRGYSARANEFSEERGVTRVCWMIVVGYIVVGVSAMLGIIASSDHLTALVRGMWR